MLFWGHKNVALVSVTIFIKIKDVAMFAYIDKPIFLRWLYRISMNYFSQSVFD